MHILDIVQNSISAGATKIEVLIRIDTVADRLVLEVKDDGCGMSEEMVARVTSPFTTSRTTRKVGLGIPLVKQLADMTNGCFTLQSKVGEGIFSRKTLWRWRPNENFGRAGSHSAKNAG